MNITKERAKEILKNYKKNSALFNWCEEYKQFVEDNVLFNNNLEVEYILKRSCEDNEAPLNYEDIENLYYTEEEIKENEEHYLKSISEEEQEEYIKEKLEEQKEVLLNNYWGRQTFGQAYSLDGCLIDAFLNKISRLI